MPFRFYSFWRHLVTHPSIHPSILSASISITCDKNSSIFFLDSRNNALCKCEGEKKKKSSDSLMDQVAAISPSLRPLRRLSLFVKATPCISKPKPLPKHFFNTCVCFAESRRKRVKSCMQCRLKAKQVLQSKSEQNDNYNRDKKTTTTTTTYEIIMMLLRHPVA